MRKRGKSMIFYKQDLTKAPFVTLDLEPSNIQKDMEKTRKALEAAYSGFNNCTDFDLIDGYVFEINALQRRLEYLTVLKKREAPTPLLRKKHFTLRSLLFPQKQSPR